MTNQFMKRPIYDDIPGHLHYEGDQVTLDTQDYNVFKIHEDDILMLRINGDYWRKTLDDVKHFGKYFDGVFCRLIPGPLRNFILLKNDIPSIFDYEAGDKITLYKNKPFDPFDNEQGINGEVISLSDDLLSFTFKEDNTTEETKEFFSGVYDVRRGK